MRAIARAKYEPGASINELRAFGFDPKTYKVEVVGWEETIPAWRLWDRIGTQWRTGAGGAVALDYLPLFHVLDRMGLDQDEYEDLFDSIRCIESEVLTVWAEIREAEAEAAKRNNG